MPSRAALGLAALLLLAGASACSGGSKAATTGTPGIGGTITVFAAASLTEAFKEVAAGFEAEHPGTNVVFNFGGSPTLRLQIEQGATADVFASADEKQMDLLKQEGLLAEDPSVFAHNALVVITPKSNPGRLASPKDLARPGLKLVLANPDVPVGEYGRQSFDAMSRDPAFGADFTARVLKNVVSQESDVKQVVAKVSLGEADAGVCYGTDVTPAVSGDLQVIPVPPQYNVVASYPMAVLKDSANAAGGRAFVDYILSSAGQDTMKKHGFGG